MKKLLIILLIFIASVTSYGQMFLYYSGAETTYECVSASTVFASCSGGNLSYTVGDDMVHVFTSSGSLTVTTAGFVDVLIVAGGGPGGNGNNGQNGGGGGGGGVRFLRHYEVSSGTPITITVGAGGTNQSNGNNSSFDTVTALGGGRGSGNGGGVLYYASSGGSGGGGLGNYTNSAYCVAGAGTYNQGNEGAAGVYATSSNGGFGGGGGGAILPGSIIRTTTTPSNGGSGVSLDISGSIKFYGGGGGGSSYSAAPGGAGGLGGGGWGQTSGTLSPSTDGLANTGGGGGGSYSNAYRSGGSGIVIVRYRYKF